MDLTEGALIELHYLPGIQYFSKLLLHKKVIIEQYEHYRKGSFRNRAHLFSSNGLLRLSIPLIKGKHQQQNIREVRIAYHEKWQLQHWQSIQSAYGNAPFFEYYEEYIRPFYQKKWTFLFDFNLELLKTLVDLIGLETSLNFSDKYDPYLPSAVTDLRGFISPKQEETEIDLHFKSIKYMQVFEEKHGFLPNLSILDTLFCKGPETIILLEQSINRN